jgi:hypothetical protein
MDIIWSLSTQPRTVFLLIAVVCFLLVAVLRFERSGALYRYQHQRYSRRSSNWRLIEQVAAIMGIISFIIQVAVWVYPWL